MKCARCSAFFFFSSRRRHTRCGRDWSSDVCSSDLEKYLFTAGQPDPDLVIRTSGEQRISNFLLWQVAYAEFLFTPVLWPEFGRRELHKAICEYQERNRRFGGLKKTRS